MSDVELVLDAHALNGESPTWSAEEGKLYWIDTERPAVHRFDPATGQDEQWRMPSEIGAFSLSEDKRIIAALRTGLMRVDLERQTSELLVQPPYDAFTHRFNDGKCDPQGRFWVGTMWKPLDGRNAAPDTPATPLYVFDGKQLRDSGESAVIANGLAWSPDGVTMYWSDSHAKTVRRYAFDGRRGTISEAQEFAHLQHGVPDGAAVDVEGCYWVANYDGARVIRFRPDGSVERELHLPVSEPTMCAFGGEDMRDLYITSARSGLSADQAEQQPLAGGLFRCRAPAAGLHVERFRG